MSKSIFLRIPPSHDHLEQIPAAVEEFGEQDNWPPDLVFKLNLVLEELGVNIVNYSGATSEIEISLASDDDTVTIEISDNGRPFNPLDDLDSPDIAAPAWRAPHRRAGGPPGAVDDGRVALQQGRRQEPPGDDQTQGRMNALRRIPARAGTRHTAECNFPV